MDDLDIVMGAQQPEIPLEVEPLVWASLQSPVVKVKAVDVDDTSHGDKPAPGKKKGSPIGCPNRPVAGES